MNARRELLPYALLCLLVAAYLGWQVLRALLGGGQ